ncbi:hypothetical protein FXN63_09660 [Pigmentiphaga aceris]|uniref:Uncharacterized protein n=1 Tax=Pigmentiphaga aceris TaxID=1940612 RepID=A0A5C0AZR5_9BURK|nr:hypothetical protein [Pigmentiphaga aceris]QEI06071.1 hypothetical protein FXN63_09660 [Pigmentiphaga aceris]
MRRAPIIVAHVVATLVFAVFANAAGAQETSGPFGLRQGMTKAEIEKLVKLERIRDSLSYSTDTLPVPHSAFSRYLLKISATHGLCSVIAIGHEKRTDSFGESLHQDFTKLKDALTARYGKPEMHIDGVRRGSIWKNPEDFMMGLLNEERMLDTLWESSKTKPLPASLYSVRLSAAAKSPVVAQIGLGYHFMNVQQCNAEEKAKENRGL